MNSKKITVRFTIKGDAPAEKLRAGRVSDRPWPSSGDLDREIGRSRLLLAAGLLVAAGMPDGRGG
jgi:hypothetical protein